MMLTEYWIFMLVWCFILGKLNALPVIYGKNLLKTYIWNTKNIHHNYKLNFTANARFLEMRLHNAYRIYVKKGNHFPRNLTQVWLKNRKYAWQYGTEMLF